MLIGWLVQAHLLYSGILFIRTIWQLWNRAPSRCYQYLSKQKWRQQVFAKWLHYVSVIFFYTEKIYWSSSYIILWLA